MLKYIGFRGMLLCSWEALIVDLFIHKCLSFVALLLISGFFVNSANPVIAQIPRSPLSPPAAPGLPTIQITSHQDGQQVPAGVLTIQGISSDDEETDCQVYADVNDITPMRNVTAAGDSGKEADFSKWTFTYSQEYQLIKQGENELTAKISCFDDKGNSPVATPPSEWHTVNVTGVSTSSGGASLTSSPSLLATPEEGDTESGTFKECLSEAEAGGAFLTAEKVQACIESSNFENERN